WSTLRPSEPRSRGGRSASCSSSSSAWRRRTAAPAFPPATRRSVPPGEPCSGSPSCTAAPPPATAATAWRSRCRAPTSRPLCASPRRSSEGFPNRCALEAASGSGSRATPATTSWLGRAVPSPESRAGCPRASVD
ncbi:MAG: hypothetical protein AVDCRST_MAG45-1333, partial [uncultured Solirubrobacterales bacterium]